jgi:hypothetical protein
VNDLQKQLHELTRLAKPIEHIITPEPNFGMPFQVSGVEPAAASSQTLGQQGVSVFVTVRGSGFQSGAAISFAPSSSPAQLVPAPTFFRSESLLVAQVPAALPIGRWNVAVTNADQVGQQSLPNSFTVTA